MSQAKTRTLFFISLAATILFAALFMSFPWANVLRNAGVPSAELDAWLSRIAWGLIAATIAAAGATIWLWRKQNGR